MSYSYSPTLQPTGFAAVLYTPTRVIDSLHRYPHLNDNDEYSYESSYWHSIETMFYLTALGGFACIFFQWIFFCFESCCQCCQRFVACKSWIMRWILIFAFAWLLAGTGLSYWARNEFQEGADKIYTLSLSLRKIFVNVEMSSYYMKEAAMDAEVDAKRAQCGEWTYSVADEEYYGQDSPANATYDSTTAEALEASLLPLTTTLVDQTSLAFDLVEGLGKRCGEIGDLFEKRIPKYVDAGIGSMTAFISLTVWFGFITVMFGSVRRQKLMIAFASIVLCMLCPLIAFELTLSVVISDFCHGLADGDRSMKVFAREFAPPSTVPLIDFYVGCQGVNPFTNETELASEQAAVMADVVEGIDGSCDPRTIDSLTRAASVVDVKVHNVSKTTACANLNPYYSEMMYNVACGDVVEGIYHLWVVQLTCAVSLWVLLFLIQCELITREKEGRLELAKQEQRLKLKPSSFTPAHGTAARRKFDKVKRKELLEEDRRLAQELAVTEEERRRDEQAWAAADAEAAAEAEADEQKQWLVKNPKGFGTGAGEERREAVLRIGPAPADKAAIEEAKRLRARGGFGIGGASGYGRRRERRTFDPDAAYMDAKKAT